MSANPELARFSRDVAADELFRTQIEALGTDMSAVVAAANEKGYAFTLDDWQNRELTDEDLALVAGGAEPALANYGGARGRLMTPERRLVGSGR